MMDIDIDFADRTQILDVIKHIKASRVDHDRSVVHNTGVYLQSIPYDPVTNLAGIEYKQAEKRGYFKIDFLNVNIYKGIKNESHLKYLMDQGCEHIFLMEDDILIKDERVFEEYVKQSAISGIRHLNFGLHGPANKKGSTGFKNLEDRKDVDGEPNPRMIIPYPEGIKIPLYPNCVGAFSYYQRSVLEKIGLFDPKFKNAWEHVEHTFQVIQNNFHPPFWYFADIEKSWEYLTDIPNSIAESTIARTPEWNENFRKGTEWYKKKHGVTPTETPLFNPQVVQNYINNLYLKR
jgi:hypothetical protein